MTKDDDVIFEIDARNPPPLTDGEKAKLTALAVMPDEAIDPSEVPPLTDAFFAQALRNPFHRPMKQQVMLRLDADVVAWLKDGGRGYQTRINAILRDAMRRTVEKA